MTATDAVTTLEECVYTVTVSDVEQDGSVNSLPAVIVNALNVTANSDVLATSTSSHATLAVALTSSKLAITNK